MAFSTDAQVRQDKLTGITYLGKEITLTKQRGTPVKGFAAKAMERGVYPLEKQVEAATLYAATGNLVKVAELSKVPLPILRDWRKEQWFQDLIRDVRNENLEQSDSKFTEIVDKALVLILDRLENGDCYVGKRGEIIRKPIGAKDLALIAAINIDKRELLRGNPTTRVESVAESDKLERLAEVFKTLAGKPTRTIDVTDAIIIEEPQDGNRST